MKIAVTSHNRKVITEHAGRCRKFWIFSIDNAAVVDKQLLELPIEQSFHASSVHEPHPLDDIDVLAVDQFAINIADDNLSFISFVCIDHEILAFKILRKQS